MSLKGLRAIFALYTDVMISGPAAEARGRIAWHVQWRHDDVVLNRKSTSTCSV